MTERKELGYLAFPTAGRNDVVLYSCGFRHYWSEHHWWVWLLGRYGSHFALQSSLEVM